MLARYARALLGSTLLAALAAGCENSRPGSGFTNEPEPIYAPEKPAVRTDLPPPDRPAPDTVAPGSVPGPETSGTGGRPTTAPESGSAKSQKGETPSNVPSPPNTNANSDAAGRTGPGGARQTPPR